MLGLKSSVDAVQVGLGVSCVCMGVPRVRVSVWMSWVRVQLRG